VVRNVGYLGTIAGTMLLMTMTSLILDCPILAMLRLPDRYQSRGEGGRLGERLKEN